MHKTPTPMHDTLPIFPDESSSKRALFCEVFAGCGRLSRAAKQSGFAVLPVDGPRNEHKVECPVLTLDLVRTEEQQCLLDTLRQLKPQAIHVALPCGTGSRARERPVPAHLVAKGAPQPRPVRNASHPLGMPGLTYHEKQRVESANKLAKFAIDLFVLAVTLSCVFSLENPSNSWMWNVLFVYVQQLNDQRFLQAWTNMFAVQFSNCAHGGERPKQTTWRSTHDVYNHLAKPCPGNHEHKPYQVTKSFGTWTFDTAAESEYPWLLCIRLCQALHAKFSKCFDLSPPKKPTVGHTQNKHQRTLIPEYRCITNQTPHPLDEFKLLPPQSSGGNCGEESLEKEGSKYGIYHTPEQFIERAISLTHPFDDKFAVEDLTRSNLFELLTKGKSHVAAQRLDFAKKLARWSKELVTEEARYLATLPLHAQKVLKGKKLLLFRKLLAESGCPDLGPSDIMSGLDLVGTASKSPFFDTKLVPATSTPQFLQMSAKWQRPKMEARNVHADDPEMSRLLWDTTLQEVESGFLEGPFESMHDLKAHVGSDQVVVSRRFVIVQSGKPRIIDDLRESGVNKSYTAVDALALHDVDYVASLAHLITTTVRHAMDDPERLVKVPLKTGQWMVGRLHPDFEGEVEWRGRCVDLSKAYKQIPVSPGSRPFAVLMVHHHSTGLPVYFVSNSLPFGASSSVFGFNRVSRSLWHIASVFCKLLGGVFFDDFPLLEPQPLCALATKSFEGLLKALGWKFSDDPNKTHPFETEFDVLGVRLSVGSLHGGPFVMQNKPSRVEKIQKLLEDTATLEKVDKRHAQVVHGNLNFALSFFLGKSLLVSARAFAHLTTEGHKASPEQIEQLCAWTHAMVGTLKPKRLDPEGVAKPVLVFTDAAYENGVATWGIVVIDPATEVRTALGGEIPASLVDAWHSLGSDQVITLAEAFAVLLARVVFRKTLTKRRALFFVDNEGARYSLIKGVSPTLALLQIVQLFHSCSEEDQCLQWIERVPSKSNIADLPSRGQTELALRLIGGDAWTEPVDVETVARLCSDFKQMPTLLQHSIQHANSLQLELQQHDDFTGE